MKNLKHYLSVQLTLFVTALCVLNGCKKDSTQDSSKSQPDTKLSALTATKAEAANLEQDIAKNIHELISGNVNFKKAVEDLCLKQKNGDYETRLSDLISENNQKAAGFTVNTQVQNIGSLVNKMKSNSQNREPVIFIPSVESFDPLRFKKKSSSTNATVSFTGVKDRDEDQVIFVFRDVEGKDNKLYPGYTMNGTGELKYYKMIDEDFAWHNNVWVIGYEENSSVTNSDTTPVKTSHIKVLSQRDPSRVEYGGRIFVTNVGGLESWIGGKLELRYFVYSSSGTLIKERAWGGVNRDDVDNKWLDLHDLIGNWDPAIWGNYQYERWIEEDGGSTTTISTPITPPGGPTTTISTTIKNDDFNCGLAAVGFNDTYYGEIPVAPGAWRIYTLSNMNFQRYNEPQ